MSAIDPRTARRRLLKSGTVCFNGRHSTLPCTVRDFSDGGAKLLSQSAFNVPDTFELNIELDGIWVACEVVWRRGSEVGVRFTSPVTIEAPKRKQVLSCTEPKAKPSLRRVPKQAVRG
jgi:PilZ domain